MWETEPLASLPINAKQNPPTLLELGVLELPPQILLHLPVILETKKSNYFASISYLGYSATRVALTASYHRPTGPLILEPSGLDLRVY